MSSCWLDSFFSFSAVCEHDSENLTGALIFLERYFSFCRSRAARNCAVCCEISHMHFFIGLTEPSPLCALPPRKYFNFNFSTLVFLLVKNLEIFVFEEVRRARLDSWSAWKINKYSEAQRTIIKWTNRRWWSHATTEHCVCGKHSRLEWHSFAFIKLGSQKWSKGFLLLPWITWHFAALYFLLFGLIVRHEIRKCSGFMTVIKIDFEALWNRRKMQIKCLSFPASTLVSKLLSLSRYAPCTVANTNNCWLMDFPFKFFLFLPFT